MSEVPSWGLFMVKVWDGLNSEEAFADEIQVAVTIDDRAATVRSVEVNVRDWAREQHDHWNEGCESLEAHVRLPDQTLLKILVNVEYERVFFASALLP